MKRKFGGIEETRVIHANQSFADVGVLSGLGGQIPSAGAANFGDDMDIFIESDFVGNFGLVVEAGHDFKKVFLMT